MSEVLPVFNFLLTLVILALELQIAKDGSFDLIEVAEVHKLSGPALPVALELTWFELPGVDAPLADHDLAISALYWLPYDSIAHRAGVVLDYFWVEGPAVHIIGDVKL